MKTSDFDYDLPQELIAQEPADKRDQSRLMVLNRKEQSLKHAHFYDIIDYLNPGDLLVLNDTKVIPANLVGKKEGTGAKIEVLLVKREKTDEGRQVWKCLVRPGKRLKIGSKVIFPKGMLSGKVVGKLESGEQIIEFEPTKIDFWYILHKLGKIPLPPYITPKDHLLSRYQTVYANTPGASAAPTAGLHFTPELLEKIITKGVKIAYLTLHTGLATFLPVRSEQIEDHTMHSEYYDIPKETIEALQEAERVVAVGTTTVRAIETAASKIPIAGSLSGKTDLFITPGYKFKVVDAMITNFHWPRSTLIMLVSAFVEQGMEKKKSIFAGRDFVMRAYEEAIKQKYRFYSLGDAMLIM